MLLQLKLNFQNLQQRKREVNGFTFCFQRPHVLAIKNLYTIILQFLDESSRNNMPKLLKLPKKACRIHQNFTNLKDIRYWQKHLKNYAYEVEKLYFWKLEKKKKKTVFSGCSWKHLSLLNDSSLTEMFSCQICANIYSSLKKLWRGLGEKEGGKRTINLKTSLN